MIALPVMERGQLTIKEPRLFENYLANGLNGSAAYREAYETDNGKVAKAEVYKMPRKPKIRHAIEASEDS